MIDSDNAAEAAVIMLQLVKKSRLSWFENTIKEFETIMVPTKMRIVRQGSFAYFLQASNLNFHSGLVSIPHYTIQELEK